MGTCVRYGCVPDDCCLYAGYGCHRKNEGLSTRYLIYTVVFSSLVRVTRISTVSAQLVDPPRRTEGFLSSQHEQGYVLKKARPILLCWLLSLTRSNFSVPTTSISGAWMSFITGADVSHYAFESGARSRSEHIQVWRQRCRKPKSLGASLGDP